MKVLHYPFLNAAIYALRAATELVLGLADNGTFAIDIDDKETVTKLKAIGDSLNAAIDALQAIYDD